MSTEAQFPDGIQVRSAPLPGLSTALFVQADTDECQAVTPLLDALGIGVVYTQKSTTRGRAHAGGAAEYTKRRIRYPNILLDAGRYSGKNRTPAHAGIDGNWVRFQHRDLKLPCAMPDVGYCDRGDLAGVETILRSSEKLAGHLLVPLPLSRYLLIEDADKVRDLIERQDRPVGIILEHNADPCQQIGVVKGLTHLMAGGAPVGFLRADSSALGALAYGAPIAAVGTRPGLRHLSPVADGGGGSDLVSMLVPKMLSYKYTEHVEDGYLSDPRGYQWACDCQECLTRGHVGWIPSLPKDEVPGVARAHSIAAMAALARDLGKHVDTQAAWTRMCFEAQEAHLAVAVDDDKYWKPKPFLKRWLEVMPSTVGT